MEQIKLAAGESVAKVYTYGRTVVGKKRKTIDESLIITNKRVIYQSIGDKCVKRKEIPVAAAEYVGTKYTTESGSLAFAVISFIIAVAAAVFSIVNPFPKYLWISLSLLAVGLAVGSLLVLVYIRSLRGAVEVTISGRLPEYKLVSVGMSNLKARANDVTRVSIMVDRATALEMVNELGAVLLNVRSQSSQKK
ncbi:MAG: hypothetical protein IJX97_03945 [Clostridia bacterium]|nr:hypothetical protein [Clostridia bacterium]MBQ8720106.1 hypothetical protein [Clostridia bacterium]